MGQVLLLSKLISKIAPGNTIGSRKSIIRVEWYQMFKRSRDTPCLEIWRLTEAKFPQNLVTSFHKSKAPLLLSELGKGLFSWRWRRQKLEREIQLWGTAIFMKRATEWQRTVMVTSLWKSISTQHWWRERKEQRGEFKSGILGPMTLSHYEKWPGTDVETSWGRSQWAPWI